MRNPLQGYFSFTKKIYLWFLFADCEKIGHPKNMKIGCIFFIMLSNGCVHIQYPTILHAEIISFIEEAKEKDYQLFAKEAQRVLLPKLKKEEMFLDELFYPGIEPKKENYQNIILLDDSYLIYFEHYQIAPYGAGIQTLKIKR